MEIFSAEIKTLYGERDEPADIEHHLELLKGRKVNSSDGLALSPVSKLPGKLHDLVQFGIRRSVELSEASVREMNRFNVTTSCVLVRSVLETACLLYDTIRKVAHAVESGESTRADELDKWITNALLGHGPKAKTFVLSEEYVVQNVLTIIQRLDKELDAPFGSFYEGLSEHAHPNYHGMMGAYFEGHDGAVSKYTDRREGRMKASLVLAICALASSLGVVDHVAERQRALSDPLAALAEKRIFERGTWPPDLKYPIRRAATQNSA